MVVKRGPVGQWNARSLGRGTSARRSSKFVATIGVAVLILSTALPAFAASPLLGVNQTGLGWMSNDQREAIIDNMQRNGVKIARIPLQQPFDAVVSAVAAMNAREIGVVLVISLNQKLYFDPDLAMRSGRGRVETSYPLSRIDPDRFRVGFGAVWRELEARKLKLLAVQVGNEINWTFNGDVPVSAEKGIGGVYANPENLPWGGVFEHGLDRYISIARIVRELRDSSQAKRETKVLAAGLARVSPNFAATMGVQSVEAGTTLRLLSARGLDSIVDARAMHLYPQPNVSPTQRLAALDVALADCVVGGGPKGCWLTEWGFNNISRTCPDNDALREKLVEEMRRGIDDAAAEGRLASAIYFEWDGKSPRSVWRCGRLSPAGQMAIASP